MSSHPSVGPVSPRSGFPALGFGPQRWLGLGGIGVAVLGASLVIVSTPLLPAWVPAIAAVAATPAGPRPTLKPGSEGAAVKELQATLRLLGVYRGTVDGVYGNETAIAVKQFQRSAGLAADGVVGPDTWNRLLPASERGTDAALPNAVPPTPKNPTSQNPPTHGFPVPAGSVSTATATPSPTPTVPPLINQRPVVSATLTPAPQPTGETTVPTSPTLPILRRGMSGPAVEGLQVRLQAIGVFRGAIDGVFGPETHAAVQAVQRTLQLEPDGVVGPSTWIALLKR